MFQIKQPSHIIVGNHSCQNFHFDKNCLIITSKGAKKRGWLDYLSIKDYQLFDKVEPNPSLETVKNIIDQFSNSEITNVIGIGGGSSLDVAKYVGFMDIGRNRYYTNYKSFNFQFYNFRCSYF